MLRTIQIALIAILMAGSGNALAALDILEHVAEAAVSDTTLPGHTAGQVVVRDCTGCDPQVWRVNAATQYFVGMKTPPVTLADLCSAFSSGQQEMLYVYYKPGTDEVTRIVLSLKH